MGFTIGGGATGSTPGDPRAPQITSGAMTWGHFWGNDASVANGAQSIAGFFDREATPVLQVIRGTSGTTNLAVAVTNAAVTGYATADAAGTTWSVAAAVVV